MDPILPRYLPLFVLDPSPFIDREPSPSPRLPQLGHFAESDLIKNEPHFSDLDPPTLILLPLLLPTLPSPTPLGIAMLPLLSNTSLFISSGNRSVNLSRFSPGSTSNECPVECERGNLDLDLFMFINFSSSTNSVSDPLASASIVILCSDDSAARVSAGFVGSGTGIGIETGSGLIGSLSSSSLALQTGQVT